MKILKKIGAGILVIVSTLIFADNHRSSVKAASTAVATVKYISGYSINLWNGYGTAAWFSGRRLANGSSWQVTRKAVDGNNHPWYQVGPNQWIDSAYASLKGQPEDYVDVLPDNIGRINYLPGYGVNLWSGLNANQTWTGRRLAHDSLWKINRIAIDALNNEWYEVGNNQWIDSNFMISTKLTVPITY